jgi:hypothetical protein
VVPSPEVAIASSLVICENFVCEPFGSGEGQGLN